MTTIRATSAGKLHRQGKFPHYGNAEPWAPEQIERLLCSSRAERGLIGDVRTDYWWPAAILALLDTGVSPRNLLNAPLDSFDRSMGTLRVGGLIYKLHPISVAALEAVVFGNSSDRPLLLQWHRDYSLLFPAMKRILYRAGLPAVTANLFDRLRVTSLAAADLLDRVDPWASWPLRADSFRAAPKSRDALVVRGSARPGRQLRRLSGPDVVLLQPLNPSRTLSSFLRERYAPSRLYDCADPEGFRHSVAIRALSLFCACEVTVDQLSDDLLERFAAWCFRAGLAPSTVNSRIALLCALWRHAWRKRIVEDLPRDVEKMRVPKRMPEAWSPEQVGAILSEAAREPGAICSVPAGLFLCAFLLTLFDTGLRVGALLQARADALDGDGWLTIPADSQKQLADQAFRLHPQTALLLSRFPAGRDLLFCTPWRCPYRALLRRLEAILRRSGVAPGSRDGFHRFRRTNATLVADAAGDEAAQRQLGHSTVDLTRKSYIDPRQLTRRLEPAQTIRRPNWIQDVL